MAAKKTPENLDWRKELSERHAQSSVKNEMQDMLDMRTQYSLLISVGQLQAIKLISGTTEHSVQDILREGVEMVIAKYSKPDKPKRSGRRTKKSR